MNQLTKPHLLNELSSTVLHSCIQCTNNTVSKNIPLIGHAIVDIHHMYDSWKESEAQRSSYICLYSSSIIKHKQSKKRKK